MMSCSDYWDKNDVIDWKIIRYFGYPYLSVHHVLLTLCVDKDDRHGWLNSIGAETLM
jgi:hypothetical protein